MALIEIKNGPAVATIDTVGAQLVSYKINGVEIMFDGATNPDAQWQGSAKNLFPNPGPVGTENEIYGKLDKVKLEAREGVVKDHVRYIHNGGYYYMPQHGFAQFRDFNVQGQTKDSCLLSITHNDDTIREYPYKFKYSVGMELDSEGTIEYLAFSRNDDNKPMVAGMGWHPAFKLHANPSQYKIVLTNLEHDGTCTLEEGVEYDIDSFVNEGGSQRFGGIISADVNLVYVREDGKRIPYVQMHTKAPNLIVWSKPRENENQDNFICIEPWNTTPRQINKLTTQDKTRDLAYGKDSAVVLEPGEVNEMQVYLHINPAYIKEMIKEIEADMQQ